MSPSFRSCALCAGLVIWAGCDSVWEPDFSFSEDPPPGYVEPPSTDNLPLVDHPEYTNWGQFPVGTRVVRSKVVTNEFGSVQVTTSLCLADKTSDSVVVESRVTVTQAGEAQVENPPQRVKFPARFRLPQNMRLEQFALPALQAKLVGEETRLACGREFKTEVFTWAERSLTGPMTVNLWRSTDIPGRMLRQEITGHQHNSVEELVEMIQPDKEQGD